MSEQSKNVKWTTSGSLVAIVTPMTEGGSIDLPAFDKLVEWHIQCGTHGIVVVGTTGESATLSSQEHVDLIAHCVKTVAGRIPVIAGTGSNNTAEALLFTAEAKERGADACLLVTPYYTKPSQRGLYEHFKRIAEGVDIPQILYNVPGRTMCDLSLETVDALADIPNIVGIKDATGDKDRGLALIDRCSDRLAIYCGEDALNCELILAGAKGAISVTANVAPVEMARVCEFAIAGDAERAREVDSALRLLHRDLFIEANPVPVKWALWQMGRINRGIRLPLVELDEKFHVKVLDALLNAGINVG
ncbi:MAG: 4-hydroxy-tetrahydrodipicolinate synthase [Proteobacteria bacterium]|nr:4-hydroxy-tetrahydrodipicolinate synthase [Pseudomonadota bacterium]